MGALELIDIIYPEHDRISCSDEDTQNGFSFKLDNWQWHSDEIESKYLPRCRRCALLEITQGKIKLTEENLEVIKEYFI